MPLGDTIRSTVENITNLPTLPSVMERLTRLLGSPQTSAEEVGRAITVDQSLTSKVLKLVNSAFYGFPGKISTVTHAVVILGFATIRNIVLTTSILDAFHRDAGKIAGFDPDRFWEHSTACGAASQAIARRIGFEGEGTCFVAGLIHDIGKIIMYQYLPDAFRQVVSAVMSKDILFYDAERELLDLTHQEIGGVLVRRWNLPQNLQDAVQFHHLPQQSQDHFTLVAIVHCADVLVRALDFGNGGDEKIPSLSDVAWKRLDLESIPLASLLKNIDEEVKKAAVFNQLV